MISNSMHKSWANIVSSQVYRSRTINQCGWNFTQCGWNNYEWQEWNRPEKNQSESEIGREEYA